MVKYIDAEKLKEKIKQRLDELNPETGMLGDKPLRSVNPKTFPRESELEKVLCLIDSLQQDQPEVDEQEYGPYARQYPKSKVSQEQPEVDFDKELQNERIKLLDVFGPMTGEQCLAIRNFARHFYELDKARREE